MGQNGWGAGFAGLAIGLTLAGIHRPAIFVGGPALSQPWPFILAPLAGGPLPGALHGAGITRSPQAKLRG